MNAPPLSLPGTEECPICLVEVSSGKVLPCSHILCQPCLATMTRDRQDFRCHVCRTICSDPQSAITKYFGSLKCPTCLKLKDVDEFLWCKECERLLCWRCLGKDHKFPDGHTLLEWSTKDAYEACFSSLTSHTVEISETENLIHSLLRPVAKKTAEHLASTRTIQSTIMSDLAESLGIDLNPTDFSHLRPSGKNEDLFRSLAALVNLQTTPNLSVFGDPKDVKNQEKIAEIIVKEMEFAPVTKSASMQMIKESIKKNRTASCPISTIERLSICLQYLGSGCSAKHLAVKYRVGHSTAIAIIDEVCNKIWEVLAQESMKVPSDRNDWMQVSQNYALKWNFPHCLGSLDGKHVRIKAPANSGSVFHNYKGFFSIVLLAIADADYRFIAIDVGAAGSQSDSGIFGTSALKSLVTGNRSLPPPEPLDGTTAALPFFFLGDDAFPASEHLLKPYGGSSLSVKKQVYNYRLSRARRCVENAFGIMSQRWRSILVGMETSSEKAKIRVKAICCLHNFLNDCSQAQWMDQEASTSTYAPLLNLQATKAKNSSAAAKQIRDIIADWCCEQGRIGGQMNEVVVPL